ncbi:hypothetical protein ZYGR_0N05610 [Zygosaccharomyces rouxii]|uniref:ZYRO0D13156p n=2 Tax=Zygosaccharomyces rouxii TaxID=4956 RepID=C5DWA3_ZYGRC|nr:uncharacterized protein ZYRO0D13156g [Zygosaccharomyces rouxii]KAH9200980.1 hypothetical protein LQ764DRAFT_102482 [Zygosaccharomyces rouxii]GAV49155.1 hypothetical protein ZYGR_0N05610 [Zygosaccharomyces rouxii]CAR28072.1 ZYRO0D13156p [Zygosaccharomyces rouxii]
MSAALFWPTLEYQNQLYKSSYLRFRNILLLKGKSTMTTTPSPNRRYAKPSPTKSPKSNSQSNSDGHLSDPRRSSRIWSVWGDKTGTNDQTTQQQEGLPIIQFTSSQSSLKSEVPPAGGEHNSEDEYTVATDSKKQLELPHEDQEPKRMWRFWSRASSVNTDIAQEQQQNDEDQMVLPSKAATTLTNTWISAADTIDYKSAAAKRDLKNQMDTQEPNILVPSFDLLPHKSVWNSLKSSALALARQWNVVTGAPSQKCVYQQGPQAKLKYLSEDGKKRIKVLIVGVHGFFPTKMIRPFIGEPTGTSLKFVAEAEEVVKKYFEKYNQEVEISKIALEREGEIFERVNFFFDVMKNWAKEINQADFIYFVCHSQGSPVTMLLLAQLIDAGLINLDNTRFFNEGDVPFSTNKKIISILAMAGINNGPFYGADQTLFVRAYQTIEKESLRELFQFQRPDSLVSQKLIRSIRIIVGSNVKIVFVGSINDQLVPLYSSMCLFVSHPNFFRATFIDRSSRTPSFIMRLVKIAGTLLNLGHDEHGIVKEISPSLAGTLTGGGHSTIYNEAQVYELGLKFALETTDVTTDVPVRYRPYQLGQLSSNPYHLPWCMRGLMYEIGHHLDPNEITQLFQEFESWEPETKPLKDVKYRLTGLKNKL